MAVQLEKCEVCGSGVSSRAPACPRCGDVIPAPMGGHESFAWIIVFMGAVIGLAMVIFAFFATNISAPQQCAVIAAAIAIAVNPYCYARAVEKRDGRR